MKSPGMISWIGMIHDMIHVKERGEPIATYKCPPVEFEK